ncbi:alcohol dehydrogenase catalytic domain-containing protein [Acetobacter sp. UBA5411]|uniref:alcohol dehydrogenase catalytic domain-containing protein n=1 Tax=Acetobacter sp. UBA5411 TaxID=1945905 RepID=UPI0038D03730
MRMKCGNSSRTEKGETTERQRFLPGGATLAAASFGVATGSADSASAQESTINLGSSRVHAYRSAGDHAPFQAIEIPRRAMGPHDVLPDIMYCGVCHSDIHTARGEWGPAPRPCISGHKIIGRVIGVGMIVGTTMTLFVLPSVYTVIRPRRSKTV